MIKPIGDLLKELQYLQVELWQEGDRLRYKAPKQTLTPELLQQLRDRKAEILAALSEDKTSLQASSTVTHSVENTFPLSFAQQRLWFLDQLEPNRAIYNICSGHRLTGPLNYTALERSLQEIVRRHESLRTNFKEYNNSPYQTIAPPTSITLPVIALESLPEASRQTEVQRLLDIEAQKTFNLATDPLWRAKLLRLSDSEHILLLTLHHIIADAWSMGIFQRELSLLYTAFRADQPSPLSALPIQYVDYTIWQRKYLQGEVLAAQFKYWTQQLGGELPILNLPTDYPRPPVLTYRGSQQSITLSNALTRDLKILSQQQGVTLFMTLLTAFKTLLHRYSGQDDIIVGSPIAGRNRQEIEPQIGFFVNTLVLRTQLAGNPSFSDLLARVREVTLSAYEHQDLPFEKIVEELGIERDRSRSPLFQVMFALQNTPHNDLEIPDLIRTPVEINTEFAKFDLTLNLRETSTGIQGVVGYSTDLFHEDTIARMLGHFQVLLEGIVINPAQAIGDLPLLAVTERHQLVSQWNNTTTDYPKDKCLHQLFEAQVERTPDAIALIFEEQTLTYRELNAKANQLAHYLQSLGTEPEVFVGICLERSLEAVIALLGILKAGGTYVFLDPTYPTDHLTWILQDTQVSIVVTSVQASLFLPVHTVQYVYLDQALDLNTYPQENPTSAVQPSDLMTVIHTSGSTGKPKGVMIEHQGVVNAIWFRVTQQFTPTELALFPVVSSFAFDGSLGQLFPPLLVGGKALLLKQATDLFDLLDKMQGVTALGVPSLLSIMLQKRHLPDSVQTVLVGAEAVSPELVKTLSCYPHVLKIINSYGPTEASIFSMTSVLFSRIPSIQKSEQDNAEFSTQRQTTQAKITIGKPIPNVQIYLLENLLQPVPIGVPGELHIGGLGLARGYLNRPELTDEKFIPNPFGPGRLYKTGDWARYLPDGNIEFLGRIDHQVKIRGFRIELGEIEATLAQHPHIEKVVAMAREDQPGEKYLVAYFVPDQSQGPASEDLRQFLKQKLPNYMIPAVFVRLDAIPLTPSGKVDRRALPKPAREQPSHILEVPRNALEQEIALIWAEVLPLKQFGIHHNFFELGGHSLKAVQVISRVRDRLHLDVPLQYLFEYPTIAEFASAIGSLKAGNLQQEAPKISARRREAKQIHLG